MIARSAAEGGEFPMEATTATVDNVSARFITLFPRAVHYYLFFFCSSPLFTPTEHERHRN